MKFYGKIGFMHTVETSPGVWTEEIEERSYYGDVSRVYRKTESAEYLNDNFNLSNSISIVADPFINNNLKDIRYVEYMGVKWKVATIGVEYPRLTLELREVYNGENQT